MRKIAIGGGVVAVLLWVFIALVSASTSGTTTPTPTDGPLTQTEICQAARLAVLDRLKAPNTVDWPGNCLTGEGYVFTREADSWTVQGQVDAQNGLGAQIRSTWQATILDLGQKKYLPTVDWIR